MRRKACGVRLSVCVSVCFFKQKTAYEGRISDWSSDVCSSDLAFIHIEPYESGLVVRMRTDGVLREHLRMPPHVAPVVVSRIKVQIGRASCRERVCQYV